MYVTLEYDKCLSPFSYFHCVAGRNMDIYGDVFGVPIIFSKV